MPDFHFYHPMQVRYSDLDTQWHVNNIQFCVYIEHARIEYLIHLGLFDGKSFQDMGLIVASLQISYLVPIEFQEKIRVGVRVARLGNKSFVYANQIEGLDGQPVFATAETIMVAYDYRQKASMPIPDHWRETIAAFENIPLRS
jgi:acyl-CoA thioester hydrolase